jgi:hypothetical protein
MPKTTFPNAGVLIVCEIARHRRDPGLPCSSDATLDLRADSRLPGPHKLMRGAPGQATKD